MYRDLGFDPDPALDEEGIFDLVAGRPYCNLSREPRMQYRYLPFEHSFTALKANPSRALYPQPTLNPARAQARFWLLLPWLTWKLFKSAVKLRGLSRTLAAKLRQEVFPAFAAETDQKATKNLASEDSAVLLERLEHWIRRTLIDFARDSLKPTVLAAVAMGNLERGLRNLGPERVRSALGELTLGVRPDPEADMPGALRDLAAGRVERSAFLEKFGHRGNQEMELAQPRWAEDSATLKAYGGPSLGLEEAPSPGLDTSAWDRIAVEAKLSSAQKKNLEGELQALHTYLGLRETAKHYLMRGYALIRRILMEVDRRYQLDGGVFYCPSTDPAWVPLFVNALGLVMETGGVLSHGAIVAREFGLPAVAGLPDIHRRIQTGQRIRVDGASGKVSLLSGSETQSGEHA